MRERILSLIENCEDRLERAGDNPASLQMALRRTIGDLYELLRPGDSTATITLNGVTVEVRMEKDD